VTLPGAPHSAQPPPRGHPPLCDASVRQIKRGLLAKFSGRDPWGMSRDVFSGLPRDSLRR